MAAIRWWWRAWRAASPRRYLIADEVGLGKTIETVLILRELPSRGELKCPVGHQDSGRESGRFRSFRKLTTRSTGGRNPAWRGDFRQENEVSPKAKRARRLSEPLHMVVGWYPVPNRVESTQCKPCGLARTPSETSEFPLRGADVQAVLMPDWLPMSATQLCRGYGQFNSHSRN